MADIRAFFNVDVGYFDNPKLADLVEDRPRAVILHLRAIAYCAQHLTDGIFPVRLVARLACASLCDSHCDGQCDPQCDLAALAQCGLVRVLDESRAEVHDYLEHQRSAEQANRRKTAGQKAAAARWSKTGDANGNANRIADRTAKGNTKKERKKEDSLPNGSEYPDAAGATPTPTPYPADFETFWAIYPRRHNKRAALTAWTRAARRATTTQILEGATRYRDDPNREDEFTQHAATWLNADGWNNEPLPAKTATHNRFPAKPTDSEWWENQLREIERRENQNSNYPEIESA